MAINGKIVKEVKRISVITFAALLMAANIQTFVRTGGLYPGGATGLTILIQRISQMLMGVEPSYTVVNLLLNAIPIYIGLRFIGRKFTLYSLLMIFLTGIFTDLLPAYVITYDTLLISIFGGLINGTAISLCLWVNATSGGTDFIAIYLSEKKNVDSWNIVLGLNIVILSAAGFIFGWDKALYSIIFQFASTQVLHMLYKKYQQMSLFIVTSKPTEVYNVIWEQSRHGATLIDAKGAYGNHERTIVYSVVSKDEYMKIVRKIKKVDTDAFVNTIKTEKIAGNFYVRPHD